MSNEVIEEILRPKVKPKPKTRIRAPRAFKVMMLNDDFTPMDFVVMVLMETFHQGRAEATETMFKIHTVGQACCGTFSRDIAETKAAMVVQKARNHEYPLQCVIEAA